MKKKITVQGTDILLLTFEKEEYISLTDIARYRNPKEPKDVVKNWLRSKNTLEFLGLWEIINNQYFKGVEFDAFRNEAGSNTFVLSPKKWIAHTSAIGIRSKSGVGGGTFTHRDIAFEFASWVSPPFKLYLIKEFQRLKEQERTVEWDVRRLLTKVNYKIHTDAVQAHLIPKVTDQDTRAVYASEADVLNKALFGFTAKEWRAQHPGLEGNIRDEANVYQLVCLSNLESLNAEFIRQGLTQPQRLRMLNDIAIIQMGSLTSSAAMKKLL